MDMKSIIVFILAKKKHNTTKPKNKVSVYMIQTIPKMASTIKNLLSYHTLS